MASAIIRMLRLRNAPALLIAINVAGIGSAVATTINPFTNDQASLVLEKLVIANGAFPARDDGSANSVSIGFIHDFAGNVAPSGSVLAQGQSLSISSNPSLFSAIGTTYGGNGFSSFSVPGLGNTLSVGVGSGSGLTTRLQGQMFGSPTVTLTPAQLPAPQGSGQAFSNVQPSLGVETLIATQASFPASADPATPTAGGPATFLGEIADFAGNFVPSGWTIADGRILPIVGNTALFSVLGTTYGGNGITTFALPDLQGRTAVGADATDPLGTAFGQESTTVTDAQLPPGGAPVDNVQPSLAINYLIASGGSFPDGFSSTTTTIGEVVASATFYTPSGYLEANGQLLSIEDNPELFSVIGTIYGGDGITTFALPDLDGRAIVGADSSDPVGTVVGANEIFLQGSVDAPPGSDPVPAGGTSVPEPESWTLLVAGFGILAARRGKRDARTTRAAVRAVCGFSQPEVVHSSL